MERRDARVLTLTTADLAGAAVLRPEILVLLGLLVLVLITRA